MVAKNNPKDIRITRVYDAPLQTVWDAWTEPDQIAKWWGPRGFTLTTHSKDLRPGGIWHYTMHGPDGVDFPNKTLYHEVIACEKLVYDHGGYDDRPALFRVTVLFSEWEGKTKMVMTATCPTAEDAAAMRGFIKDAGGNATWDRLAEHVNEAELGRNSFVINCSFESPIVRLFEMWTDPTHLAKWLPPVGFEMEFLRTDFRVGESSFYRMSSPDGVVFYGQHEICEIVKPDRLVYTQRFCDEHKHVSRHPGLPVFPEAMLVTVIFTKESEEWTRITLTSEPVGTATAEEIAEFINLRQSMTQGWSRSFDKLESLIAGVELERI